MDNVEGTGNHLSVFNAGRLLKSKNISTNINAESSIQKEAVDFFLAGTTRTKGVNSRIGVSAWKNELGQEASEFDFGAEEHLPWINYYVEMGFQFQQSTDFYYFSISATDSNGIFFLNEDQINTFNLLK